MGKINNVIDGFDLKVMIAIFAFVAFFSKSLIDFTNYLWVDPIAQHVKSDPYKDFFFFAAVIYLITNLFFRWTKGRTKKYSNRITLLIILIAILYAISQCFDVWEMRNLFLLPSFKYADIIWFILGYRVLLHLNEQRGRKMPIANDKYFLQESPITDINQDDFGYQPMAHRLYDWISKSSFDTAFCVGVTGRWGAGKSSFINLVKNKAEIEGDLILMEFNPWTYENSEDFYHRFFQELRLVLAPFHESIDDALKSYAEMLFPIAELDATGVINSLKDKIGGAKSIQDYHNDVELAIQLIGKKIVVVIDDVDRLESNEVLRVLKLVRNAANFNQCCFILAYDKEYLFQAIRDQNESNYRSYLDKIVQYEVSLPSTGNEVYVELLFSIMKDRLGDKYYFDHLESYHSNKSIDYSFNLKDWLHSKRDVIQLCNAVLFNIESLKGEVHIYEFLMLQLLRIRFPIVYRDILLQKDKFLTINPNSENGEYMLDNPNQNQDISQNIRFGARKSKNIKEVLSPLLEGEEEETIQLVIGLCTSLFSNKLDFYNDNSHKYLSIRYPMNFYKYFYYDIKKGSLSVNSFNRARSGTLERFKEEINRWIIEGALSDVVRRFELISSYINIEEYHKIIKAIVFIGRSGNTIDENIYRFSNYPIRDLLSKLRYFFVYDKLNSENDSNKEIVHWIFSTAKAPYQLEMELARCLLVDQYDPAELIEVSCLYDFFKNYLSEYSRNVSKMDRLYSQLWWTCIRIAQDIGKLDLNNVNLKVQEVIEMKHAFGIDKGDVKGVLSFFINSAPTRNRSFCISKEYCKIYGGWDELEAWVETMREYDVEAVEEFKVFFEKFEQGEYRKYVEMEFVILTPE